MKRNLAKVGVVSCTNSICGSLFEGGYIEREITEEEEGEGKVIGGETRNIET